MTFAVTENAKMRNVKCADCDEYRNEWCKMIADSPHPAISRDCQYWHKRRDLVEVVRCKDCKYGEVDNADFPNQYFCNHHGCDWNEGNHYCSYGERADK